MNRPLSNDELDRRLRDVHLPSGLLPSLHAQLEAGGEDARPDSLEEETSSSSATWTEALHRGDREDEFDGTLCDVPLPLGFFARLHEQVRSAASMTAPPGGAGSDEEWTEAVLDQRLRQVALPADAWSRWHAVAWQADRARTRSPGDLLRVWQQAVVAAALTCVLAGLYATGVFYFVRDAVRSPAVAEVQMGYPELPSRGGGFAVQLTAVGSGESSEPMVLPPASPGLAAPSSLELEGPWETDRLFTSAPVSMAPEPWQVAMLSPPARTHSALAELQQTLATGMQPWQDVFTLRYDYLGYPVLPVGDLPELSPPPSAWTGGIEPSESRGFDRAFFLKHGHYPWVFPGRDPALRRMTLPLGWEQTSYDEARRSAQQDRLPKADEIAVDQWLAAFRYGDPVGHSEADRGNPLGWHWAAGPSAFAESPSQLLQVVVQAPPRPTQARLPRHLTLVVDRSASMRGIGPLDWLRSAARRLAGQFDAGDRFSCVVFNEDVTVIAENARREHVGWALDTLDAVQAQGGTDVAAALFRAVPIAMWAPESSTQRHMVVVTDGKLSLPVGLEQKLLEFMGLAASQGLQLTVVNVDPVGQIDPAWEHLVERTEGRLVDVQSTESTYRALGEALLGEPPVAATDVQVTVDFDPGQVLAYRLVGGRPTSLGGLAASETAGDVLLGQSTSALWELRLREGGRGRFATARMEWTEPGGEPRTREIALTRALLAPSFEESAPSLQAATLIAEAGSILAKSPFAQSREHTLSRVLLQAERASLHLSGWAEYREFLELVRRLRQLGGERGP